MTTQTKTQRRQSPMPSDPMTWAVDPMTLAGDLTRPSADLTRPAMDLTRPGAAVALSRSSMSGMTPGVNNAASALAQGATAAGATVPPLAPSGPIGNGNATENAPRSSAAVGVDSTSTKPNTTPTRCEQCGAEFLPKTRRGRFCSAYCRRRAWLERNPEKAAELAERDRARLKAAVIARGGVWVERMKQLGETS